VLPVNGGEPLRLAVTPAQSMAPATVRIRARVEPSPANGLLAIVADGEEFYRSSEIRLEADQASATVEVQFLESSRRQLRILRRARQHRPSTCDRAPVGEGGVDVRRTLRAAITRSAIVTGELRGIGLEVRYI
jgi:hypothetical protein